MVSKIAGVKVLDICVLNCEVSLMVEVLIVTWDLILMSVSKQWNFIMWHKHFG